MQFDSHPPPPSPHTIKHRRVEYDKIDVSEGIDVNKTNASKECHYWYFKDMDFKYEPCLCNGYHGLMQKAMNFNDVAIVSVKGNDPGIHFWYMSPDDAIDIMNNSDLSNKRSVLEIFFIRYKK